MTSAFVRSRGMLLLSLGSLGAVACVVVSTSTSREMVDKTSVAGTSVSSPIKAHLLDGSVILFTAGAAVSDSRVTGVGRRFDVSRKASNESNGIALDSVVGFEVYHRRVNPLRTLVYGAGSLVASVVGIAIVGAILFGSCPTVYADSAGVETLQAESFSY